MHDDFKEYCARKSAQYGDKWDPSDLNPAFIPYFNSGERVEVAFCSSDSGKVYETKRGTISVTTGYKPVFLLMLTRRSIGSSYTIGKKDKIIKVI